MPELIRSGLVITRSTGVIEHPVYVLNDDGTSETLLHLSVLPSGHATAIDYETHPNYEPPGDAPALAAKAKQFLDLGGQKMLGHPNSPASGEIEASVLKARHKL